MQILLVASTSREINPLLQWVREDGPDRLSGHDLDILVSGVGLLASGFAIQKQLGVKRPDLVIQAGVAGSFDPSCPVGSVRVVSEDRVADQGALEKGGFQDLFDLELAKPNHFPYKRGRLPNPHKELIRQTGLRKAAAITVNNISNSAKSAGVWQKRYQPILESMEGAALHYVCLMENIPFLQIRAVSNPAGVRDKRKWNLPGSIQSLNKTLVDIFSRI